MPHTNAQFETTDEFVGLGNVAIYIYYMYIYTYM